MSLSIPDISSLRRFFLDIYFESLKHSAKRDTKMSFYLG